MNVGAIFAAMMFLGATVAGGFGLQSRAGETEEIEPLIVEGSTPADASAETVEKTYTTMIDEGDVVIRAYYVNSLTISVETEKQHDGKWYVYPFKGASEIIVDISYEPTPACAALGFLNLEPQSSDGNSKRYVVELDSNDWGTPQIFMIAPDSFEGSGIALDMNYHIKIQCDGIPPAAPSGNETIVFEGDILAGAPIVDLAEILICPLPMLRTSYEFNVPQNATRVEICCSWSNEYEGLMFTIIDGAGENAAFRGNGGIVGTQSPSPLNTIVNTVKHPGEWEILMHNHVNVACHYKIEITTYF